MTFPAQSPDLRRFPLVAGASRSVVRSPRSAAPRIRFLFVDSRVRCTLRSAYASRRTPCASLRSLRPGSGRTFTSKSSPMPGPPPRKPEAQVTPGLPASAPPGTRTPNLLIKSPIAAYLRRVPVRSSNKLCRVRGLEGRLFSRVLPRFSGHVPIDRDSGVEDLHGAGRGIAVDDR